MKSVKVYFFILLLFILWPIVAVSSATIYVPDDYPTIQQAIYAAHSGDIIQVRAGTYNEDLVMANGVTIQGEGADATRIIGTGNANVVEGANNSKIDGFTIHNPGSTYAVIHGVAITDFTVSNCVISSDAWYASIYLEGCSAIIEYNEISCKGGAAGIVCDQDPSYTTRDNSVIRYNIISNCQNGIRTQYADTEIYHNTISDNKGVGIYTRYYSTPNIHNNIIARNGYFGIWCSSSPIVKNNIIFDNYPCGIEVAHYGNSPEIAKNIIYNHFYGGVWCEDGATPLIKNNIIFGSGVAGIGINNSNPIVVNNTICHTINLGDPENQGVKGGNGIYIWGGSSPTIKNNIISNSLSHGIYNVPGSDPAVSYNDLWNNTIGDYFNISPGTGDIRQDPLFQNSFDFLDITIANGTTTTIEVFNPTIYSIGDHIEYNNDGVIREVTAIDGTTITFTPPLSSNSAKDKFIYNWTTKIDPSEDFHLKKESPAIDAGDPTSDYSNEPEPNGGRINMGAYGNTSEATISIGSISGTIFYSGSESGIIYILAWQADSAIFDTPDYSTSISSVGPYVLSNLPANTYYIASYMDVNDNNLREATEPFGVYGAPDPVTVFAGGEISSVDITLTVDTITPTVTLVDCPESVVKENLPKADVTFSWEGSDNITSPENLVYQYKLEGSPSYESWSSWTSETTKIFTLPSGDYIFKVRAKDEAGNYPDEGDPATATCSFTVSLPIIVYPNPCYPNKGQVVTIANLPLNSKVYIYTISGELVRILDDPAEITEEGGSATATWDLRNDAGEMVARGVYIYFVPQAADRKTGKIAIIK